MPPIERPILLDIPAEIETDRLILRLPDARNQANARVALRACYHLEALYGTRAAMWKAGSKIGSAT